MKKILFCALLLSVCCSCTSSPVQSTFFAMDTVMTLELYGDKAALEAAKEEILRLDSLFSIGKAESDISRLNSDGEAEIAPETAEILTCGMAISQATGGALELTIAPLVDCWGWYEGATAVPDADALSRALSLVDGSGLTLEGNQASLSRTGMAVDLGCIAKGYSASHVAQMLSELGISSALINLGGNVQALGTKPDGTKWVVGIADASDPAEYLAALPVSDCAVVTSGDYQRYFEEDGRRYHHILNPKTGYPTDNGPHSVTVVCADGTLADGLSTALFVMGLSQAEAFWRSGVYEFEAVFQTDDGLYVTAGLADSIQTSAEFEVIAP